MRKIQYKSWKEYVQVLGYVESFLMFCVLFSTFMAAFFTGGKVVVDINSYGEGHFEAIAISVVLCLSGLGLMFMFEKKKEW